MFEIEAQANGEIACRGRLDASQVESARPRFDALEGAVTADLSQLEYISSAGLGLFVRTHKRLVASGHALKLINPTPHVRNVFHYAGLSKIFGLE